MPITRIRGLALGLGLIGSLLVGCSSEGSKTNRPGSGGFSIGAAISLTGNASLIGQDQRIGLELAERHFAKGKPELKLLLEDSGSDEQTASFAFRNLIKDQVVAILGPSLSQQAFAVDPIADRAGVPVVSPSNTAMGVPEIGPFIARVSAPVSVVAPRSIAAALKLNPRIRRVAVFVANDDAYSTSESKIFQQTLQRQGLNTVSVQRTSTQDSDFQKPIADVLAAKPDLIVISALTSDGGNLVRQLREMHYQGTIVAGNGMNTPNILPVCQQFCEGLLIAQAYSPETTTASNTAFLKLYRKVRGSSAMPPQFTAQAFTAYQVVHEAMQKLAARQPAGRGLSSLPLAELRRQLNSVILAGIYQTPLGEIRFTPEGEVVQKRFYVARVSMDADGRSGRFSVLP